MLLLTCEWFLHCPLQGNIKLWYIFSATSVWVVISHLNNVSSELCYSDTTNIWRQPWSVQYHNPPLCIVEVTTLMCRITTIMIMTLTGTGIPTSVQLADKNKTGSNSYRSCATTKQAGICVCVYIYIYIYIRLVIGPGMDIVYVYIYIYIYILFPLLDQWPIFVWVWSYLTQFVTWPSADLDRLLNSIIQHLYVCIYRIPPP